MSFERAQGVFDVSREPRDRFSRRVQRRAATIAAVVATKRKRKSAFWKLDRFESGEQDDEHKTFHTEEEARERRRKPQKRRRREGRRDKNTHDVDVCVYIYLCVSSFCDDGWSVPNRSRM